MDNSPEMGKSRVESSPNVSFAENPLIIHMKSDPPDLLSLLFAVAGNRALISSEGDLGWVDLDRFTVESDLLSLDVQPRKEPDEGATP